MSSNKMMGAMEGMFDPELSAAKLLDAVKENVVKTVKTVEAADTLIEKLSEEAAKFNEYLTTMSNAIRRCESGEITREEMLADCAPCVTALKEKCTALKLVDTKTNDDDITEAEIAMLREYIVGCKDIVVSHREDLQAPGAAEEPAKDAKPASEGVLANLANYDPATEAVKMHKEIRYSTEAKTAHELYKQAKRLYGLGSKEQALTHLKKAQALYEKCLAQAEEHAKMYETERTVGQGAKALGQSVNISDKFTRKVTDNANLAYVIDYFEDRIDACKALELQWNNKAGKSSFKETKAQLKAERKEIKKQKREERKAAKQKAKEVPEEGAEEAMIDGMTITEFIDAMESYAESIEIELALEAALEAEGVEEEEVSTKSASGLTARFRAAFAKLKKAKVENKSTDAADAVKEIDAAAADMEEAANDATTPEEKKKLSKGAKAAIAVGASVAAAAGLVAIAAKAKKLAESPNPDAKGVAKLLAGLGKKLKSADIAVNNAVADAKMTGIRVAADATRKQMANASDEKKEKLTKKMNKLRDMTDKVAGSYESVLTAMAFGMESFCVEDECDEEEVDAKEGKAFDDDDLEEAVVEANLAVMFAEDGIDDSDLD